MQSRKENAMADLLLDNIDSNISDEEIKEFLIRYGFPPFDKIEHLPGDGSRPSVLLTFEDASPEALRLLQPRIHQLFWKNHMIEAIVINKRSD
jgi:hypothetical protein